MQDTLTRQGKPYHSMRIAAAIAIGAASFAAFVTDPDEAREILAALEATGPPVSPLAS